MCHCKTSKKVLWNQPDNPHISIQLQIYCTRTHIDAAEAPIVFVVDPSGQGTHSIAPKLVMYEPTGQDAQRSIPVNGAYRPGWHRAHVADDVAPTVDEAEPAGHSRQSVCAS